MKKMRAITFVLVVGLIFMGAPAAKAEPIKTNLYGLEGLFFGTPGTTIEAGQLVVGASMLAASYDDADLSVLPVTVTYGATRYIELAGAFEVLKSIDNGVDETGTGDVHLLAKFSLQDRTVDYPATAVGVRVKLPTAQDDLGTDETDFAVFGALDINMRSVKGILNAEYVLAGGDYPNQVNYVVGVQIPYSDATDFSIELLDQNYLGDMIMGGATFDMGSAVNFGFGIGVGLDEDTAADFAVMGKLDFSF